MGFQLWSSFSRPKQLWDRQNGVWLEPYMRWGQVCANLMKIFITHNCARVSWPSSPHLATFLPPFGHVWETIFSSVFLTELFHHISFGCFHSTCSQEQCFLMKKGVVCGWIGAIKNSLGLGWVGANYGKPIPSSRCILLTNDACDGPIRSEHALLSTNGKPFSWNWRRALPFFFMFLDKKTCFQKLRCTGW